MLKDKKAKMMKKKNRTFALPVIVNKFIALTFRINLRVVVREVFIAVNNRKRVSKSLPKKFLYF